MEAPVKGQIRFAEDIMTFRPPKPGAKSKKVRKKGAQSRGGAEDEVRIRGQRRGQESSHVDEEL